MCVIQIARRAKSVFVLSEGLHCALNEIPVSALVELPRAFVINPESKVKKDISILYYVVNGECGIQMTRMWPFHNKE